MKPRITTHLDRRAALEGADFVINIVQVGMNDGDPDRLRDPGPVRVRQTIGDTLGVGGVFRALRTFPVLQGLAEDIAEVCPDAWLLNYTNPMAMNVWYLPHSASARSSASATRSTGRCTTCPSWSAYRTTTSPTSPPG